jgi:hypothetical protein
MHWAMHTYFPDDSEFPFTGYEDACPWYAIAFGFLFWFEHEIFGSGYDLFQIDLCHCFCDIFTDILLVPSLDRDTETSDI